MIEQVQAGLSKSESVGQQRMRSLHSGGTASAADLEVSPNLWAGVGLVRGGAGTALVGSHAEVADRIAEYHALGITEFVLSGYPHLEEAYWVGEGGAPRSCDPPSLTSRSPPHPRPCPRAGVHPFSKENPPWPSSPRRPSSRSPSTPRGPVSSRR